MKLLQPLVGLALALAIVAGRPRRGRPDRDPPGLHQRGECRGEASRSPGSYPGCRTGRLPRSAHGTSNCSSTRLGSRPAARPMATPAWAISSTPRAMRRPWTSPPSWTTGIGLASLGQSATASIADLNLLQAPAFVLAQIDLTAGFTPGMTSILPCTPGVGLCLLGDAQGVPLAFTMGPPVVLTIVPEPVSGWLLLTGAGTLLAWRETPEPREPSCPGRRRRDTSLHALPTEAPRLPLGRDLLRGFTT